jgi:hypothetical protein
MSDGYFERLEVELSALTRSGAHLDRRRSPLAPRTRRAAVALLLSLVLAVVLVSEFPAAARGQSARMSALQARSET